MEIKISPDNTKMGKVASVSLPPRITCGKASKHCGQDCYAHRYYRMYPPTEKAYNDNLEFL